MATNTNTNTNMQTMISLQQASTDLAGLQLVGATVTVSGNSAALANASNSPATWTLNSPSAATGNVSITNSSGQTVFTGTTALNAGSQTYSWNGQGTNGVTWPDGNYTLSVTATGANGQPVTLSMGGVETLQITAPPGSATGSLNGHFYMFVPFVVASPFHVSASISGATVSIQFPTQSGHSYTVYYSTSLNPANWQTLTAVSGNGAVETVTDSTSGGAKRFYRVQAQ